MPRHKLNFKPERVVLVVLAVLSCWLLWDRWRESQRRQSPAYLAELANQLQVTTDIDEHAQSVLEQRQLAEAKTRNAYRRVESWREQLDTLEDLQTRLASYEQELLEGPAGQAIASDREALEQVHALMQERPPNPLPVDSLRQRLLTLQTPLQDAIDKQRFAKPPSDEAEQELAAIGVQVDQGVSRTSRYLERLKGVANDAPPAAPQGAPLLKEALAAVDQEWAAKEAEQVRQAVAKVRQQYAAKLAQQQAEAEQQLQEQKLLAQRAEQQRQLALAQAEQDKQKLAAELALAKLEQEKQDLAAAAAAEAEKAKRKAALEAEMALVRQYLQPFITPGHQVPDTVIKWDYTEEAAPLSLAQIQGLGALDKTDQGYSRFMWLTASQYNDRPNGVFGSGYLGAAVRPEFVPSIVKAQGLLKKHGQALVEAGLLKP